MPAAETRRLFFALWPDGDRAQRLEERAFAAHVTLLRNASESDLGTLPALETIAWPVSEFVLVESQLAASGASYRIIDRWPLAAADGWRPPAAG